MEKLVRNFVATGAQDVISVKTSLIRRELGHIKTVDMEKKTRVVMDKLRFLSDFGTLPYGYK